MPSVIGAGMAYVPTSSPPATSSSPSRMRASGPGSTPNRAWSRTNTSVSSSRVTSVWTAMVSVLASGTRRASAPTPLWTPSSTAACTSQPTPSTSGINAPAASSVAA